MERKCRICNGTGMVPTAKRLKKHPEIKRSSKCFYCKGRGFRESKEGIEEEK